MIEVIKLLPRLVVVLALLPFYHMATAGVVLWHHLTAIPVWMKGGMPLAGCLASVLFNTYQAYRLHFKAIKMVRGMGDETQELCNNICSVYADVYAEGRAKGLPRRVAANAAMEFVEAVWALPTKV